MSICGFILGFITAVVSCVKPNSTTSLNLVAAAPMSIKQLWKDYKYNNNEMVQNIPGADANKHTCLHAKLSKVLVSSTKMPLKSLNRSKDKFP